MRLFFIKLHYRLMRRQILRHEREHRDGTNRYLQNPATSINFSDLEKLTGSRSDVSPELCK